MAGAAWYFQAVSSCSEEVAAVHRKDFIIPPGDVTRKPDDPSFVQKDAYWTAQDRFLIVIGVTTFVDALRRPQIDVAEIRFRAVTPEAANMTLPRKPTVRLSEKNYNAQKRSITK
ncbi:hypothetical protein DCAR_0936000 [Daucus carota subsp. sativus]|uniref:Uncharacterized protein n=1 Tax=Daucus carota subsp. sativus TaxID=79200 RepID=A0A175YJY4_DAUCS|nr:hypothetical protein DCAR_0936000 [Daucus carota subsp. sativus]